MAIGTDVCARPLAAGEEGVWADLCAEPEDRTAMLADVRAALVRGGDGQFWLAWRGAQPVGALWGAALPGRGYRVHDLTAGADVLGSVGVALLDAVEAAYGHLEVGVRGDDAALAALLAARGMGPVGELVHVERALQDLPAEIVPLELEPATTVARADFERAFASALTGTRVPGLAAGSALQVLAFLGATSPEEPDWRVARLGDDIVGVVMPSVHPACPDVGSLGFIGVVRAARGCGLGRRLHRAVLGELVLAGARVYRDTAAADDAAMLRIMAANGCETVARERIFARPRQGSI